MVNRHWLTHTFRDRGIFWALVAAAALRLAWLIWVPVAPNSDGLVYDMLAQSLADGNVYGFRANEATAYWPPGTSFLYSLIFRVFGHVYWPISVLNLVLGVVIVYLTACLALAWFGLAVARIATLVIAVWPSLIIYTTVLASELPFIVLMLLALLVRVAMPSKPILSAIIVGGLCAAATYIRTEGILLPIVFALAAPPSQPFSGRVLFAAIATACLFLLVSPWAVRNTALYEQPVFLVTSSGTNLWMGNNPDTTGGYMPAPALSGSNEPERDAHLRTQAIQYIVEHPGIFVLNTLTKAVAMHTRETIAWHWVRRGLEQVASERVSLAVKWTAHLFWVAVLFCALIGVFRSFRRDGWRHLLHPAFLIWLYITAIHAVTIALQDRFHFPSNPFIAMYAGSALVYLGPGLRRLGKRRQLNSQI